MTVRVGLVLVVLLKLLHLRDRDVEVASLLCVAPVDPQTTQQHESSADGHHHAGHHQAASLHMQEQRLPQLCRQKMVQSHFIHVSPFFFKLSGKKQLPYVYAPMIFGA